MFASPEGMGCGDWLKYVHISPCTLCSTVLCRDVCTVSNCSPCTHLRMSMWGRTCRSAWIADNVRCDHTFRLWSRNGNSAPEYLWWWYDILYSITYNFILQNLMGNDRRKGFCYPRLCIFESERTANIRAYSSHAVWTLLLFGMNQCRMGFLKNIQRFKYLPGWALS